jgi:hypothetical protein
MAPTAVVDFSRCRPETWVEDGWEDGSDIGRKV